MFLNALTQEDKTKFMELIYLIANIDDIYSKEEQELVNNYQVELNMPILPEMTDNIDDILAYFAVQSEVIKKIVIFEIYGLILSDCNISPQEQNILDVIDNSFGIEVLTISTIKGLVKELQDVYDKIYDVFL